MTTRGEAEREDRSGETTDSVETQASHANAGSSIWRPTEESIVLNAQAACEEARRHISAQATDSEALDTKAAALLTVLAGAFTLGVTHVSVQGERQVVAGTAALVYVAILVGCLIQATRPRETFSYGAWPSYLAELVPTYPHWTVMQRLAEALGQAREGNVMFLFVKQRWYERALVTIPFVAFGVALMATTGALK